MVCYFIILQNSMTRYLLVKVDKKENRSDQSDLEVEIKNLGKFRCNFLNCIILTTAFHYQSLIK